MPNVAVLEEIEVGELISAITATPLISNPAHRYPTALRDDITAELAIVNANQPLATGGSAQAATAFRNEKRAEMESASERVRLYFGSCSDLREKTPELAKIGFQPKRDAGDAHGSGVAQVGSRGVSAENARGV